MTDHTPEPWGPLPDEKVKVVLTRADWDRARACVNACAGIPTEQLNPEVMQRLIDALGDIYDLARQCDWQMEPYSAADALEDLQNCGRRARSALDPFRKD